MFIPAVRYDFRHFFFSLMWASISVGIAAFARANGRLFCNRPRLHKPRCWCLLDYHFRQLKIFPRSFQLLQQVSPSGRCLSSTLDHFNVFNVCIRLLAYLLLNLFIHTNFIVIIASKLIPSHLSDWRCRQFLLRLFLFVYAGSWKSPIVDSFVCIYKNSLFLQ